MHDNTPTLVGAAALLVHGLVVLGANDTVDEKNQKHIDTACPPRWTVDVDSDVDSKWAFTFEISRRPNAPPPPTHTPVSVVKKTYQQKGLLLVLNN